MSITANEYKWFVTKQYRYSEEIGVFANFGDEEAVNKLVTLMEDKLKITRFGEDTPGGIAGVVYHESLRTPFKGFSKKDYLLVLGPNHFKIVTPEQFENSYAITVVK